MTTLDDRPSDARARGRRAAACVEELAAELDRAVAEAARQARALGRPVLASAVTPAPGVDPLDALEHAGENPALAADLAAGRVYWARPTDGFAFAGAGAAAVVAPAGAERFGLAERAWAELLDGAVLRDASGGTAKAGPLLAGGFAFDPAGPRTARWRGFPTARLVLPRVQVAAAEGACWVTANVVVGADGRAERAADRAVALARGMLAGAGGPGEGGRRDAVRHLPPASLALADERPAAEWQTLVADAAAAVRAGAFEKVVLARAVRAAAAGAYDVGRALRHLRTAYPDCYVFGVWGDGVDREGAFVGASPERLVRVDGRRVRATSLAGSAPRDPTEAGAGRAGAGLLASAKDRAEHAIVRGWLVDALGGLCDEVRAAPEPSLRALANVYHLHTDVTARLRPGRTIFDLLARLHPTPAVGGAPRGAALQFIAEREELDRGWYAAPVGWVGCEGGEFAVGLRSALVRGAEAWAYAGCGIVGGSDPAREYEESRAKLRAMEAALAAAAPPA